MDIEVRLSDGHEESYTVRFHEGDALQETEVSNIRIDYGPRDVKVGTEVKKVPGEVVTIASAHVARMKRRLRWEKRIRPSAKSLANKEKAEIDTLKQRLGVS